jgi:chitosanase
VRPVRGIQDAHGNAPGIVHGGPRPLSDRARILAGDVAERAPERAEALPSGPERDVGDRAIGITEQRGGALDAPREQIAVRRHTEGLLERAGEMRLRHAAHAREPRDGPFLVRRRIHAVLRAQQAAQQLGVLAHPTMLAHAAAICQEHDRRDAARPFIVAATTSRSPPVNLTATQCATIRAIVNLFETGDVLGDYGSVTLIPGDTGHLTFGRSQTTLPTGNLHALIARYCANVGARFGARLAAWLPRLEARDVTLDDDRVLHNVLRATADDPVMREIQDRFFDEEYFDPAVAAADRFGITQPLGVAVVYDSTVHGSWERIRDRVAGTPASRGERAWIRDYVAARLDWLATHERTDLRATVYRMEALGRLIEQQTWALELPLVVRGAEISSATLAALPRRSYDGPAPGARTLSVQAGQPLQRGLDVRLVQLGLSDRGLDVLADGVFGRRSSEAVAEHQRRRGSPPTGIADAALIMELVADVMQAQRPAATRRKTRGKRRGKRSRRVT